MMMGWATILLVMNHRYGEIRGCMMACRLSLDCSGIGLSGFIRFNLYISGGLRIIDLIIKYYVIMG